VNGESFYDWLLKQGERDDLVGYISKQVSEGYLPDIPVNGTTSDWVSYVTAAGNGETVKACLQATREWRNGPDWPRRQYGRR